VTYPKDELLPEICARLAKGEPMAVICRDPHMPGVTTLWEWQQADAQIAESIARARLAGEEELAAQCLEIADTPRMGVKKVTKPLTMRNSEGDVVPTGEMLEEITEGDMIEHRKLQIDARLKLLAKWNPKKWGDKQQIEHSVDQSLADRLARARSRARGES
jgi:hypothetical protein